MNTTALARRVPLAALILAAWFEFPLPIIGALLLVSPGGRPTPTPFIETPHAMTTFAPPRLQWRVRPPRGHGQIVHRSTQGAAAAWARTLVERLPADIDRWVAIDFRGPNDGDGWRPMQKFRPRGAAA